MCSPLVQDYFQFECDKLPPLDVNWAKGPCRNAAVSFPIDHVDVEAFERALVSAIEHAGHRLRFRNIGPVKAKGTRTGWKRE